MKLILKQSLDMILYWSYTGIKFLYRLYILRYLKKSLIKAETIYKLKTGSIKLDYAAGFIMKKLHIFSFMSKLVKDIVHEEFDRHKDFINRMIIRERIVI